MRDVSHAETEEQAEDVRTILTSLGVDDARPSLEVWNKLDLLDLETRAARGARAAREEDVYAISALTGEGLSDLLQAMAHKIEGARMSETLQLGFEEGRKRAWLYSQDVVTEEKQGETGFEISVLWTKKQADQFGSLS